nr:low molecular weight phosphatase family protein [Actinomycetota bacterium]
MPTVLVVCTGNICRSPLAEALLRTRFAGSGLRVHSAGTHALPGVPMTDPAQQVARARGVPPALAAEHRSRVLTEPLLDDADLILTMTAEQRDYAVQLFPRRLHRVFPVREFARLAQGFTDARVREIAAAAGGDPRRRLVTVIETISGNRGGAAPKDEDVVDPYRRPLEVYEQSAAQLTPALAEVERVLAIALG